MTFEQMEQDLRQRLEALPPAARAEVRQVLRLSTVPTRGEPAVWNLGTSSN